MTAKKLNILLRQDYFERFYQLYKTKTQKEAWEQLEKELSDGYGVQRYSSFESFKWAFYKHNHFEFKQL